jgi:hypothetical protein
MPLAITPPAITTPAITWQRSALALSVQQHVASRCLGSPQDSMPWRFG